MMSESPEFHPNVTAGGDQESATGSSSASEERNNQKVDDNSENGGLNNQSASSSGSANCTSTGCVKQNASDSDNEYTDEEDVDDDPSSSIPDVFKCSICFEILLDPTTINCGHSFCRICLARWFEARKLARQMFVCPECRKQWAAYPEIDYSLRDAMEIWYPDILNTRRSNMSYDDRSVLARFRTIGPATFAQIGSMGRPILNRRIPINWRGMQLILALLMNAALILGIILVSLVVMLVAPGPDMDEELHKDDIRIDAAGWSVEEVDQWMDSLGAWTQPYRPAFRDAKIDGSWLMLLDEDILTIPPLNVDNKLIARRLYSEITQLKYANNPRSSSSPRRDQSLISSEHYPAASAGAPTEVESTSESTSSTKTAAAGAVSRQKIFVLILGLLHFPRTITVMSYFVIDFQPITEFLNSVRVIQKDKFEEELPEVSWWVLVRFMILPQFTIVHESLKSGGHIEGFVRLLVFILLIRMCEELKLYYTSLKLLLGKKYLELYRLWMGEFCRFGRDFSMVVAMGYLHTILPSALIDVYFCYIVCYPALAFFYSVARLLYRRVPFFRNIGLVFVQSMERGLNILVTYLLRLVFGWLIPQIIRLLEPAFRQAAADQRQAPQPPQANVGIRRVRVDEEGALFNFLAVDVNQDGARMRRFPPQNLAQNDIPLE